MHILAQDLNGMCGNNLFWSLDTTSNVLKIKGTGKMTNYMSERHSIRSKWYIYEAPWLDHSEHIKRIIIGDGVTSIGDGAFNDCYKLVSVSMPKTMKVIGKEAFSGCFNLSSVVIPDSVREMGDMAFGYCSKLSHVKIPSSLEKIGAYTFRFCSFKRKNFINKSKIDDYLFSAMFEMKPQKQELNSKGVRNITIKIHYFDGKGNSVTCSEDVKPMEIYKIAYARFDNNEEASECKRRMLNPWYEDMHMFGLKFQEKYHAELKSGDISCQAKDGDVILLSSLPNYYTSDKSFIQWCRVKVEKDRDTYHVAFMVPGVIHCIRDGYRLVYKEEDKEYYSLYPSEPIKEEEKVEETPKPEEESPSFDDDELEEVNENNSVK